MSELDPERVALVTAAPEGRDVPVTGNERVSTGYFLTGDLVLTVRHAADRPDWAFSVRAETGQSREDRWSDAKPVWIGDGDVDAILLRTNRSHGNWELPSFLADKGSGTWKSAGFARAAADTENNHRKTLPLDGSFDMSGGQGPRELVLRTEQIISAKWDTYWKGISGAPIFATGSGGDNGLAGIITGANGALANGLIGLPAKRLLDDISFRSGINPPLLGRLPSTRFCLVLSSEGANSELAEQTGYVLKNFMEDEIKSEGLHEVPISISALEAVRSPENWAAAVNALARARYLVADVTSFQPAVMLLLGVRSVLRRGVTISVTEGEHAALSSTLPFNVQETKVLSFADDNFASDLHRAMAEGSANLGRDSNYLDLPAYHAVRAPRPESWADDDDRNLLVLCPFSVDYSQFYRKELRKLVQGLTKKTPLRMLDLESPRLVGQALYEQMRWSSWCLVDWTEWRPNVFFELGVRLACSERDPMCIVQRGQEEGKPSSDETRPGTWEQYRLLRNLLDPVVYDREAPREALKSALGSWPSPPLPGRSPSPSALPLAATYQVAQANFQWQWDPILTKPHLEQRQTAERIFGLDPERRPERLVLFADNERFDARLRDAVREKWIAAWLYVHDLCSADEAALAENEAELLKVANRLVYELRSSDSPRHVRLRREIRDYLRSRKSRRDTGESVSSNG